jgi:hypothetical protein
LPTNFFLLQLVLNPDQIGFIFRGKVPPGKLVTDDPDLGLIPVIEGLADGLEGDFMAGANIEAVVAIEEDVIPED